MSRESETCSDPPLHSQFQYFSGMHKTKFNCAYCKTPDSNASHLIFTKSLSLRNYERFINLGWARIACYVFIPLNEEVCCPVYTLRNDVTRFCLSKSQRKIVRKFRNFIITGDIKSAVNNGKRSKILSNANVAGIRIQKDKSQFADSHRQCDTVFQGKLATKRRPFRCQRKRDKLIEKGIDPNTIWNVTTDYSIESFGDFLNFDDCIRTKHQFTTKLVKVYSLEFLRTFYEEYELFKRYEVYSGRPDEISIDDFMMLCLNPFGQVPAKAGVPRGTFHSQYYLDGKLIGFGVFDILNSSASSMYFVYDPDFNFLNLGTLTVLHELLMVNQFRKLDPHFQYYYIGHYVHSCSKTGYKRYFRPCEIMCPVSLKWTNFDRRIEELMVNKGFAQFEDVVEGDKNNNEEKQKPDEKRMFLMKKNRIWAYDTYPFEDSKKEETDFYFGLIGTEIASDSILYIPEQNLPLTSVTNTEFLG